jgi:hypothetical protein
MCRNIKKTVKIENKNKENKKTSEGHFKYIAEI